MTFYSLWKTQQRTGICKFRKTEGKRTLFVDQVLDFQSTKMSIVYMGETNFIGTSCNQEEDRKNAQDVGRLLHGARARKFTLLVTLATLVWSTMALVKAAAKKNTDKVL